MSAANELELESELESPLGESEFELAGELAHELGQAQELINESELEHEHETEHEAFFNSLAAMADRSGRSQSLRRIALAAARSALKDQVRPWPVVDGEGELEGEHGELESAHEFEFEASPARLADCFAAMEHEGHSAAEAANEQEAAEHFLPLVGLAAKFVLPKLAGLAARQLGGAAARRMAGRVAGRAGGQLLRRVAPRVIRRATPQLTRGLANVTRTLFRNPTTRPLLHAVPRIARTTVARLARQVARGKRITPQMAIRTLAQQTARTLSDPRALAQTYRRSLALDRRYHRRTRRVLGRPVGAPVRAASHSGSWPGVPYAPAVTPGGIGWPAQTTNGYRCTCQPGATGAPSIRTAASTPMVQAAPMCPTCGRV